MKSIAIAVLLLQAIAVPTPAPLAPSGKWVVNYEEADCLLSRNFGTGPTQTSIGFKPSPFGGSVELVVITIGAKGSYRKGKAKLTLQPSGLTVDSDADIYGIQPNNIAVTTVYLDGDAATQLPSSTGVTVAVDNGPSTRIAVSSMKSAFGALTACQADLVKSWGIDPAELAQVAVPPVAGSPAAWLSTDDYPRDALSNQKQGTSVIVWTVNTDGRVSDCKVVKSSGTASLDQAACRVIALRGRYKPAIGLDGKPMAAHQMRKVVWRIP